jgi:deazaflavin-dependent oxidoreductase (nitroreductase family)
MRYPRWLAKINKRVFNPREVRKGKRPAVVHTGRASGTTYRTPLDAHPAKAGYVLVVRHGAQSDWVRNTLAAGGTILRLDSKDLPLAAPRLATRGETVEALAAGYEPGADFFKADHYLLMDHAR